MQGVEHFSLTAYQRLLAMHDEQDAGCQTPPHARILQAATPSCQPWNATINTIAQELSGYQKTALLQVFFGGAWPQIFST